MVKPFKDLCFLCEELSKLSKRTSMANLVSNFIKDLDIEELEIASRMIIGEIFPPWSQLEFDISGATIWKIMKELTGITDEEFIDFFNETGDLGSCVKEIFEFKGKVQTKLYQFKPLSITDVNEHLKELASIIGEGSRKRKEKLLKALLERASPIEAKYIVKFIIGERRHGFGEGLMIESISKAFNVPSEIIRRANMFLCDVGKLAALTKKYGSQYLRTINVTLFHPVKPMLAGDAENVLDALKTLGGRAAFEIKPDGARVQIHKKGEKVKIFSRRLTDVTNSLPDIVEMVNRKVKLKEFIIEGEVIVIDENGKPLPFQYVMRRFTRVKGTDKMMEHYPAKLYVFDILYADGRSLINKSYENRRRFLENKIEESIVMPRIVTSNPNKAEIFFKYSIDSGHEGLVAKRLTSTYTPGIRGKHWLKIKENPKTLDLVIVAAEYGYGYRFKWLSDYHLAARDEETGEYLVVGKTFTGLTDKEIIDLTSKLERLAIAKRGRTIIVQPKIVLEIAFSEIQKSPNYRSGYALRFARIKRIRSDKTPEEADTIQKIIRLYEDQFKRKGKFSDLIAE